MYVGMGMIYMLSYLMLCYLIWKSVLWMILKDQTKDFQIFTLVDFCSIHYGDDTTYGIQG